jgi:hypothetical protein
MVAIKGKPERLLALVGLAIAVANAGWLTPRL